MAPMVPVSISYQAPLFNLRLSERLLRWIDAFHVGNFAAKRFEHLLDGGVFFSPLTELLFLAPFVFFL